MGISALVSHKTKTKRHQEKARDLNSSSIVFFFKNITVTVNQQGDQRAVKGPVSDDSPQINSPLSSSVKLPKVMAENVEIRWTLKVVLSHFHTDRVLLQTNFLRLFPDSAMANEFEYTKVQNVHM